MFNSKVNGCDFKCTICIFFPDIFFLSTYLPSDLIYNFISLFWLSSNVGTDRFSAIISMFAAILYLSTNTILIGLVWYRLKSFYGNYTIILFVLVWTCVEFIKSYGLLAFPWISIANTQIDYLYLIQISEYVGIYGITFWILCVNGFIYFLINIYSGYDTHLAYDTHLGYDAHFS